MDVVVLGGGGIGSVYAAFLARAGHQVRLVTRGAHLDVVRTRGLAVHGLADFTAQPDAVTEANGPADVLVLATKTYDTASALRTVAGLRPAMAFSIQNGIVKDRELTSLFGPGCVLGAVTMVGATRTAPGEVEYTIDGPTIVGELGAARLPRLAELQVEWRASGLAIQVVDDILAHEWAKQALQAGASPLAAMTHLPTFQIWGQPPLARSLVSILREVAAVAAALGIELSDYTGYGFDIRALASLPFEEAVARVIARGHEIRDAGMTNVIISMSQDIQAGRRTEIEETVGYVAREADRLGVDTPLLHFAYDVVRGVELASGVRN